MKIQSYDTLRNAIISYIKRDDFADAFDIILGLVETRLGKAIKFRRAIRKETATLNTDNRFIAVPANFFEVISFRIIYDGVYHNINHTTKHNMVIRKTAGVPLFFNVGNVIEFDCIPSQNFQIEMQFYSTALQDSLSETVQSNVLIVDHPDLYFYACMAEAYRWAQDDEQSYKYEELFKEALEKTKTKERAGEFSPATRIQSRGVTP